MRTLTGHGTSTHPKSCSGEHDDPLAWKPGNRMLDRSIRLPLNHFDLSADSISSVVVDMNACGAF